MTAKSILNMFEEYRRARISFVQTVADLTLRPANIDVLKSANVVELLKPLLSDICPQIQQCAAVAIGRFAHHDPQLASDLLAADLIQLLLKDIHLRNKYYKKSAMFAMRAICSHNATVANDVIQNGGLEALILCLADHDTDVKESATWATGYIARHSHQLARSVVDAGVIPHLVLSLQEPELHVRRIAASALSDIAKHGPDLAQTVCDASAIPYIVKCISSRDDKLKRQALMALSSIARHSNNLAELVVQAQIVPSVLCAMGHACYLVRRNAAMLIRDIVKHSVALANLVSHSGGVGALVEAGKDEKNEVRIVAITSLGFIAGHCSELAACVQTCEAVKMFSDIICDPNQEDEIELLCVCVWACGQVSRHCTLITNRLEGLLGRLLFFVTKTSVRDLASEDGARLITNSTGSISLTNKPFPCELETMQELKNRCKTTLRLCIQGCTNISVLEPLVHLNCPFDLLKHILVQFTKILPRDPRARRLFVTSGGLAKIQEIEAEPGSALMEYITIINACFPDEIVRYYSPGYPDSLLEKVEQFAPKLDVLDFDDVDEVSEHCGPAPSKYNSCDNLEDEVN